MSQVHAAVGWKCIPLGEACEIVMGQSPEGSTYNSLGKGEPLLNGPTEFGTTYPTATQWTTSPSKFANTGDILLCVRGATTGKKNKSDRRYCIGRGLAAIRARQGLADTNFIWFVLDVVTNALLKKAAGSTFPNLPGEELIGFEIALPPLSEQQRLAAILSEQMAAVEKARAAAEAQGAEAARLQSAYFRQAFRGIVPLAVLEAEQSSPPSGWRWQMLGDIARLESGHTPSRYRPDWWGGGIPWLALPDIRNLDGLVAKETAETTNEQGLANSSARLLPESTVCLSRTASVGFVTILGRPMATSQDFVNWICGPKLDPFFLMHLLRASRDCVRSLSSGAIHKTVYMPTVKAFRVCVPDLEEQQRIATFLNVKLKEAEVLRSSINQSTSDMAVLPAVLLRRAFSGQL